MYIASAPREKIYPFRRLLSPFANCGRSFVWTDSPRSNAAIVLQVLVEIPGFHFCYRPHLAACVGGVILMDKPFEPGKNFEDMKYTGQLQAICAT